MSIYSAFPFLVLGLLLAGCGGGGGEYFPPSIAHNLYGIAKSPLGVAPEAIEDREAIASRRGGPRSVARSIQGRRYYYFRKITFAGEQYALAVPIEKWIAIIDSQDEVIAKLPTPRYTRDAVAVELRHPAMQSVLAILIDQQSTSHSSTLYMVDSSFTPIYREHLLEAHWIGKEESASGDVLLISTGGKWRPQNQWIDVGGDWRYDVFGALVR